MWVNEYELHCFQFPPQIEVEPSVITHLKDYDEYKLNCF